MKKIGLFVLAVFSFCTFSARSQNFTEIDRVRDTVLQTHLNDEF